MTTLDDTLVPLVTELLAEFGTDATFTRTQYVATPGSPDEIQDRTVSLMTRKITPPAPVSGFLQGGQEAGNDLTFMLAAEGLPFVPDDQTTMRWNGNAYRIIDVVKVASGDEIAAIECRARCE